MNYDILNKADKVILDRIEKDEIKGASLCVIHKGDTVYFRSFGMADVARLTGDDSLYQTCETLWNNITTKQSRLRQRQ